MFIWQAQYMQCQWLWRAQITWNSSMVALVIYTWPQHSLHLHLVIPRSLSSKKENYRSTYSPQWSTYGSQMSTYVMKQSFHFQPVEYQTCQTSMYQLGTHTYVCTQKWWWWHRRIEPNQANLQCTGSGSADSAGGNEVLAGWTHDEIICVGYELYHKHSAIIHY